MNQIDNNEPAWPAKRIAGALGCVYLPISFLSLLPFSIGFAFLNVSNIYLYPLWFIACWTVAHVTANLAFIRWFDGFRKEFRYLYGAFFSIPIGSMATTSLLRRLQAIRGNTPEKWDHFSLQPPELMLVALAPPILLQFALALNMPKRATP